MYKKRTLSQGSLSRLKKKERRTLEKWALLLALIMSSLLVAFFNNVKQAEALSYSSLSPTLLEASGLQKQAFAWSDGVLDLKGTIHTWRNLQAVTGYKTQVVEMVKRGYSPTRILDLLALKSMECNRWDGRCIGLNEADLWPFQINRIHKEQYNHSKYLMDSYLLWELYLFQLTYANKLVNSYGNRYCWAHIFAQIGRTYTNERRFKCVAVSYNGSPRYKKTYAFLGWKKRQMISDWLKENSNLFTK